SGRSQYSDGRPGPLLRTTGRVQPGNLHTWVVESSAWLSAGCSLMLGRYQFRFSAGATGLLFRQRTSVHSTVDTSRWLACGGGCRWVVVAVRRAVWRRM